VLERRSQALADVIRDGVVGRFVSFEGEQTRRAGIQAAVFGERTGVLASAVSTMGRSASPLMRRKLLSAGTRPLAVQRMTIFASRQRLTLVQRAFTRSQADS